MEDREFDVFKTIFGIIGFFVIIFFVGSCIHSCNEESDKPLTYEEMRQIEERTQQREMRKRLKNAKETIVVYSDGSIGYAITY